MNNYNRNLTNNKNEMLVQAKISDINLLVFYVNL